MSDELTKLLRENFEYNMTNIHTSFPGKIVSYNAKTRKADIQPFLRRQIPGKQFIDFPVLPDVPVQFPGTKECTIHFPLRKGDEVAVHVSERSLDNWREGGGIDDADPRRFNLQDCYATPGLQASDWPETPEEGLSIIYNDFKTNVVKDKATMEFKDIKAETDGKEVKTSFKKNSITGDVAIKGNVDVAGDTSIKGKTKIDGNTEITGGTCKIKGSVTPSTGPFCALPNCLFTGAPHGGDTVAGT